MRDEPTATPDVVSDTHKSQLQPRPSEAKKLRQREAAKRWAEKNPDKRRECARRWAADNRQKLLTAQDIERRSIAEKNQKIYLEAKAKDLKFYFTGCPCPQGHICERDVLDKKCVECKRARAREYGAKNPHRIQERKKKWIVENPERHKETQRKWRSENIEHRRELSRSYWAKNPELAREKKRKYRAANPHRHKADAKRWIAKNPDKARALLHNRRARLRGAKGTHTAKEIQDLLLKQRTRCANSSCVASIKLKYHKDHIMPLILGGSNDIKNIQLLCPTCNMSKGRKHPIVWAQLNGMLL